MTIRGYGSVAGCQPEGITSREILVNKFTKRPAMTHDELVADADEWKDQFSVQLSHLQNTELMLQDKVLA